LKWKNWPTSCCANDKQLDPHCTWQTYHLIQPHMMWTDTTSATALLSWSNVLFLVQCVHHGSIAKLVWFVHLSQQSIVTT